MFSVLVDKDAEAYAKHCKGNIDDTLCVAVLDLEVSPFGIGEGEDGSMAFVEYFHVDIEQEALQTQPSLGGCPKDIAVYLVLVDATCQQMTDVFVDDRTVGVEGECTCVAHHGCVEADSLFVRDVIQFAILAEKVADDFACSTHVGL